MSKPRSCDWSGRLEGGGELECRIRAAGQYVQPSDDLRPKVLESVRTAHRQHRLNVRSATLAAVILVLAAVDMPSRLARLQFGQLETATRVNQEFQMQHRTLQRGMNPVWALYEAFFELRTKQASLFRQPADKSS